MKRGILTGMIITTLVIASNTPGSLAQDFDDVQSEHINRDAIEYLQDQNVIEGYSDDTYKPENRINRAEFMKIIVASQIDTPTGSRCFSDVKDEWFAPYICEAKKRGWISGHPDGTFKPADKINFAEASKIITKALEVEEDRSGTNQEWFAGFVNGLAQRKAIPSSVHFFDKDLSRGEMAEVIWRLATDEQGKVSQSYQDITNPFPSIQSCQALKEKFEDYQSGQFRGYPVLFEEVDALERAIDGEAGTGTMFDTAAAPASESKTATDFSETNLQVRGVDEADIIKNDGKYIYMIKENTVRIIEAYPENRLKEVGKLEFTEEGFWPQEMFLNEDQLVVIGRRNFYYPALRIENDAIAEEELARLAIYPPYPYQGDRTTVFTFDISDRSEPEVERKVSFDGNYHTSRRIGDQMILIANNQPNFWALGDVEKGEDLLPKIQDGDKEAEALVDCDDIRYFPGHAQPSYLIVANIPLDQPKGEIERQVFLGNSENVYSSRTHLYVATSEVNYDRFTDWDWRQDKTQTLVFKFSLDEGGVDFIARGRVPGRILNQFSMDAHINHFRIATTQGNLWDEENPSTSNVFVLDRNMETVGSIEGIAPGERIFSTRFLGNRLYMVTFRQVDPLFVIDLKTPTSPRILGELKIPGFSDYLHPFDDNHIIGFGKETEEDGDRVLLSGFKMALFDVSDVTNPKQKFVEHIGDRGSYSELLNNHKALLFDKDKGLLAFPITIVEKVDPENLECSKHLFGDCPSGCERRCLPSSCFTDAEGRAVCTDDCNGLGSCIEPRFDRFETTFIGAVVYNLNELTGFEKKGQLTHYDSMDQNEGDYFPYNFEKNIQRLLYMDDVLYSISPGVVKASDLNTIEELNVLNLE